MNKVLLIILDGFGEGRAYPGNAIILAKTPFLAELKKKYPWTVLKASGEAVGIPEGTQGGSEVGHFTIGAGRVTLQSLTEINRSIENGSFFEKTALIEACKRVKEKPKAALHLVGMISDQGVHAHIDHLFALLELAKKQNVPKIFIHGITDGRDVPERSAIPFIESIQKKIRELGMKDRASIASLIGRYYAMDRDYNWKRIKTAYDLYTLGAGKIEKDPIEAVEHFYAKHHGDAERGSDYYLEPIMLDPQGVIKDKDSVIFWNYRTDRARQLTWAFTGEPDPKTGKPFDFTWLRTAEPRGERSRAYKIVHPFIVCIGDYSHKAPVVFPTSKVKNNLGEVIAKAGLHQFRIAETQKYAHVTYFFNSQIETPFPLEDRHMVESPKCLSYAEKPEMSAKKITDALLPRLASKKYALIVLNFANCDLVGHSGELKATIRAVETVDACLARIIPVALENEYAAIVTGDHGNAEYKIYEKTGEPCPSHTTNPVPCVVVSDQWSVVREGELQDVAPTILKIMGIKKPKEMTGESLV